ncbi:MAG: rhomboid family intramembrane serine protease [Planctomycetota bacterium]|jgi:rhomboid protease GluP|nr:rhomboid family intramembrane serine protease [Planctomycetota bacterium]
MADWYFRSRPGGGGPEICPRSRRLVRPGGAVSPYCARRLRPEGGWRARARTFLRRPDAATRLLLGLIILAFVAQWAVELLLSGAGRGGGFYPLNAKAMANYLLGGSSARLVFDRHEYWRLAAYIFLHAGFIHIFFNGWMLLDLGRLVEAARGARETFAVFVLTGIGAGLFSCLCKAAGGQDSLTIGASGSICGLLGLLLGHECRMRRPGLAALFESGLMRSCVYILIFGLVVPGIDNAAHLGGLISGGALGYYLPAAGAGRLGSPAARLRAAAPAASLAMLLAAFLFALYNCVSALLF